MANCASSPTLRGVYCPVACRHRRLWSEASAMKELTACALLLRYLCDTAAAPLQRCLVEREDAFAGDVSYNLTENLVPLIKIELDNVPIKKLESARDEARKCLSTVRSGVEPIDMERMRRLLRKQLRESMASLESDPHHAVAFRCIGDSLYSQNEQDFISRMNPQQVLMELLEETADYWIGLLKKYFTDDLITIVGSPNIELQNKMSKEEMKRIEEQQKMLGESGLAKKAKQLANAMEYNERPPPEGLLASIPVPSCDKLKCHNIATWSSDGEPCPYFDLKEVPLYTRVHSLNTNFVYINIILDTTKLEEGSRRWLPLLLNGLGECAVRRGGALVPHEDVISTTEHLTVLFTNSIGFDRPGNFSVGQFGNFVHIEARCEPGEYVRVVQHLHEVLYAADLTKDRLLVFAQRMINDVAQVRRNGNKMVYDMLRDALYCSDSNVHWCSVLRQHQFLKEVVERLGGGDAEAVLEEARGALRALVQDAWLHLAADFDRYKLGTEPWKRFARDNEITPLKPRLYWDAELMKEGGGGFVVGVGGVESSFAAQLSPGPLGHDAQQLAPLLVALNYFTQLEGPMWRLIRGGGLSYGYSVRAAAAEGRLVLSLYRAANAPAAYAKAKTILEEYLKEKKFDEELFLSARSTALFEAVEQEKCPADVVRHSLLNYLRRLAPHNNRELVRAIGCVQQEEAGAAAARWLPALVDPGAGTLALVCHPTKVSDLQAAFQKININLEAFESMEASHFNK